MQLVFSLLANSLAVFVAGYILPGVHINSFVTAIVVAIVLGILNTFVKPILVILTLPITLITFGLFALVINTIIILVVASIVPGFRVDGFLWALAFSLVLSLVNSFLNSLVK